MLETFGPSLLVFIIIVTLILLSRLKDDGFGQGLLIWLIALITFFFLGYTADLSILLGAIMGVAVGYIVSQFKAKDVPDEKDGKDEKKEEQSEGRKLTQTLFLPWRERVLNRFKRQADNRSRSTRRRRRGVTRRP